MFGLKVTVDLAFRWFERKANSLRLELKPKSQAETAPTGKDMMSRTTLVRIAFTNNRLMLIYAEKKMEN